MLSIYTTEEIISSISQDGEDQYAAWYNLIEKTRPILKILFDKNTDYETNDYNPVHQLVNRFDITMIKLERADNDGESAYFTNFINLQQNSVDDSCAIFILDVDKNTAQRISNKYGVICHSFSEAPITNPLFQESIEKSVDKSENNRGWHELILNNAIVPCSSLVFIDRYLFSNDSDGITSQDGLDNVYEILNNVLPSSLGVDFHVLLIFDATTLKDVTFEHISTQINKMKKRLNRSYNIIIETLSIKHSDYNYRETHNRRILSNYFIIRAEHSLKAFHETSSLYTQSLWLDWVASKGVVRQLSSDAPAKTLYKVVKEVQSAIVQLRKSKDKVLFSQNGNSKINISQISNRLIHNNHTYAE